MVLAAYEDPLDLLEEGVETFPPEAEFVISALEAGSHPLEERRQSARRLPYRVRAVLRLFSDDASTAPALLYTRNVSGQAVGFITTRSLTLSHGGVLHIPAPDKQIVQVACTILRCREAATGWFEGACYFNREQRIFAPANLP